MVLLAIGGSVDLALIARAAADAREDEDTNEACDDAAIRLYFAREGGGWGREIKERSC
jgi:hypothetical protein